MSEVQVIIVGKSHASEDDLVDIGTQGDHCHHIVIRLVRVCEERDLLPGHKRVVQVDTGDTGRDQLRRLPSLVRVYGRASDLSFLSFDFRTSVDRLSVSIEEAACQLVADFQYRRFSQE